MSTAVVGSTITTATPGTSLLAVVPTDTRGEPVQEGDLLIFAFVIMNDAAHNATDFRTDLTLPDGWQHAGFTSTATNRVIFAFKYVELYDPVFYQFDYLSSVTMAGIMIAIRGAARSYAPFTPIFTPPNFTMPSAPYENGFFAPGSSVGTVSVGGGTTLASQNGSYPRTQVPATRMVYVALQADPGNTTPPLWDDPIALPTLHQFKRFAGATDGMTVSMFDVEYANAASPQANITIKSNESLNWLVTAIAVESFDVQDGTEDNYKGKVMRGLLKNTPWDTSWGSGISDLLTVIGASDNEIGGLFGDDDFLDDEGDV